MPVTRTPNFKEVKLNIVGSSVYGIYDKMDSQKTFNLTISDDFLVPYPGYKIGISSEIFNNSTTGRGIYESVKLGRIVVVFDEKVYLVNLDYNHRTQEVTNPGTIFIGSLETSDGNVFISENNKPQILISDGVGLYIYDPSLSIQNLNFTVGGANDPFVINADVVFSIGEPLTLSGGSLPTPFVVNTTYYISSIDTSTPGQTSIELADSPTNVSLGITVAPTGSGSGTLSTNGPFQRVNISFIPGYITFHDTYFLAAARGDGFYAPPANNTWRLSSQDNGFIWANLAQSVGLLETKPDNTQAVVRFPSKGNMILVMGETVTEFWYDTGAQLFPYQRQNQGSIDYGCLNPATVAYMDEIVVWLARNEKSGPIIMYTTGGMPTKVTTDGIDYQLSEIETPESAEGFLFRKNGHIFYHLNFYEDNISFVVDFTFNKIYNACDQHYNYYSMGKVIWFNNQYYSITKDNGNLFIFDTLFTTYDYIEPNGNLVVSEIPRIRICDNIRLPSQDYFILNDLGFTIEMGETNYYQQNNGPLFLITEEGNLLTTEELTEFALFETEDGNNLIYENGNLMITESAVNLGVDYLIAQQDDIRELTPRVDLSLSYDGGASFSSAFPYVLNPIGKRKNRLRWWQCGIGNDIVPRFIFWGIGRVVATDGVANIRE